MISVLLMIAIAVAASLVAYAWIMGYLSFTTQKVGVAVQVQSIATDNGNLVVYVQNVGQRTVEFKTDSSIYVNDELKTILSIDNNPLEQGKTATIITNYPVTAGEPIKVKVVATDGTFTESTNPQGAAIPSSVTLTVNPSTGGSVTKDPDQSSYAYGTEVTLTATPEAGYAFESWSGDLTGSTTPTTIITNGNKIISAVFSDVAGPTIGSVTVNPSHGHIGTDFEITAAVTDLSGVQSVVAQIQRPDETNVATVPLTGTGTYTGTWDSASMSGGTYYVDIVATDTLDNSAESNNAATIGVTTTTTLLSDGFTNWNTWDASSGSWYLSPDQHHGGRYSAKSSDGQEGYFQSDPVDTTGAVAVCIDFWYREDDLEDDDLQIYYYDGSGYDFVANLVWASEDTWLHYIDLTTDPQYFKSNFHLYFRSTPDDSSENAWIDDVQIYRITSAFLSDGFENSDWDVNWDNPVSDWYRSTTRHGGSYSASTRNNDEGYFYSDTRDTRGYSAIYIGFWYMDDDLEDDGSDLQLHYYDGGNYDWIANLGSGTEDQWLHYVHEVTDSQYFKSNFRLRFTSSPEDNENAWIDDVIIAGKPASPIFSDGFETWDDNWDATSSNWLLSPDQKHGGSYAAKSIDGQEGNFDCDPLNAGSATAITVDFWYRLDDLEDADLQLYYYDGSAYDFITDLGTDPEDTWRHYTHVITDPQYFTSNFRIRFSSSPDDSDENLWIDDVIITMETIPP